MAVKKITKKAASKSAAPVEATETKETKAKKAPKTTMNLRGHDKPVSMTGKTTGLKIGECWRRVLVANEQLANGEDSTVAGVNGEDPIEVFPERKPGKPLTDAELKDWMAEEFPDREGKNHLQIASNRRGFNNGVWPAKKEGEDRPVSHPYGDDGTRLEITHGNRGKKKVKAEKTEEVEAVEEEAPAPKKTKKATKKTAPKRPAKKA